MNTQDDGLLPGMGGLALADSLNTLRAVIEANRCESVAAFMSATATALEQHQDFDGCMVVVNGENAGAQGGPRDRRSTSSMPAFLKGIIESDVIPAVADQGQVFTDAERSDRMPTSYGSLLGVPVMKGTHVLGGLIVWSQQADVLMPWHRTLLEMLAEVTTLVLRCLDTPDSLQPEGLVEPASAAREKNAALYDTPQIGDSGDTGYLAGPDDREVFERSIETIAVTPVDKLWGRYILFIDVDRFRFVREYGGQMTADRTIRILSDLLRRELAGEKLIGRLGTNHFGVVVERRSWEQAIQLAKSLVDVVDSLHLTFAGQRYDLSVSIGIAELKTGPGCGIAGLQLARQACLAVQKQGGGAVLAYGDDSTQRRRLHSEGRLLNRLTRAIKDDSLELYAQLIAPAMHDQTPAPSPLAMHEVLLRMRDDEGHIIDASAFLTLAERFGVSVKLDRWVIKHAFRQIASTRYARDAEHRFTLNLSGHSVDDRSLLQFIVDQFELTGLPPQRICFEITETAAISDIAAAIEFVEELKKLGCEFALDDFGSGHSSFLYLRDLPVDYLKIDGELVREIENDPVSLAFVRTIASVAQLMGRRTIAEHVESQGIRDAIAEIGCDYVQGYQVGFPIPLTEVLAASEP